MRGRFFDGGQIELGLLPLEMPQTPSSPYSCFVWIGGIEKPATLTVWHGGVERAVDDEFVVGVG